MLACDEPACMTDISSLGSDLIIIGDIGKVENITQVNLQLLSSSKSKVISRASKTVEGDDSLVDAVKELPSELFQASPNKKKVIKKKIIHKKKKTLVDL